jgi:hypothetical protein
MPVRYEVLLREKWMTLAKSLVVANGLQGEQNFQLLWELKRTLKSSNPFNWW